MAKQSIATKLSNLFSQNNKIDNEINSALDEISDQLAVLNNKLVDTKNAPVTVAEIETRVGLFIDAAASRARGSFIPHVISLPGRAVHESQIEMIVGHSSGQMTLGGLVLLGFRGQIFSSLVAEAVSSMKGEPLDDKTRAITIREIENEIKELERSREKLIRQAAKAGVSISRSELASAEMLLAPDEEI